MQSLEEYLNNSLIKHIAIELKDKDIVYEKYGEYDGCEDLSKYIYDELKNHKFENIKIYYKDVKHIENICFDELDIIFIENNHIGSATYFIPTNESNNFLRQYNLDTDISKYSTINQKTLRFEKAIIIIEYSKIRNNNIVHILNHELNHLYTDYQLQLKGINSFFDIFSNDSYKKYTNYVHIKKPLEIKQLKNALYLFNQYEQNAFISQLCSEIRNIKKSYDLIDINSANQIYDIIKSLDIYKAYMNIANFINDYDNNTLTKKEINNIIDEWKNIYNETLSIDKIFKKLKNKFIKKKRKIESIITKKIIENDKIKGCKINYGVNL